MKQTRPMFEFSRLSEYTRLYPNSVRIYAKIAFSNDDSIHVQISCKNKSYIIFFFLFESVNDKTNNITCASNECSGPGITMPP